VVDPSTSHLRFYWKDEKGNILGNINNLKAYTKRQKERLTFAMNAGMYKTDHSPQGLYIQDKVLLSPIDTQTGKGNFYIQPNGVFYINYGSKGSTAAICKTKDFSSSEKVKYATQSGPMLVVDSSINSAFTKGSANLNIRNGVGILPNGQILFAMSKEKINFYDFAAYFQKMGCKNALYLDGFVSRMYLPEKAWIQTDGDFGVLIGLTDK
jgi:uncharacterized protein YigE (DUF2233 family)